MIELSSDFFLGRDTTRIKDPADAERQAATATALLERLFNPDPARRYELQVLADEVGMGKTFVALAVAYSVLAHLRRLPPPDDLDSCAQRVVIITPQNSALFRKWQREVSEFVGRCVAPEHREDARQWFAPKAVERQDELIAALRKPGPGPRVVVTHMGAFGSARLHHLDLKRRHLLGVLFRYWGNRFPVAERERLLRGAPEGWPRDPSDLVWLDPHQHDNALFTEEELLEGIRRADRSDDPSTPSLVETVLESCRAISAPYVRDRDELFRRWTERDLVDIYRAAISQLGRKGIPLVIVDEAHNWKNGPSAGANGYYGFADALGRRTRRLLLLTATPFQLRPEEMLELLAISDSIRPTSDRGRADERCEALRDFRERHARPVLERAAATSRAFARAWGALPHRFTTGALEEVWSSPALARARTKLERLAHGHGVADVRPAQRWIDASVADLDPDLRGLFREALRLYLYNADLSAELGRLVIRHRRPTDHRLVRVGAEFALPMAEVSTRSDRHLLHAAEGLDVQGEAELPHYLLMRCVTEMKGGRGRSSLGSDLTGCYSTLLASAQGRAISERLKDSPTGQRYLHLLLDLVGEEQDPTHPKVATVVESILRSWRVGEKTLVFCFRTHTAERLRSIVDTRIRQELKNRRQSCLGGEHQLRNLRARLTGRERDLVSVGLDRVLWSFLWAAQSKQLERIGEWAPAPFAASDLFLGPEDMRELARALLRFGVSATGDRVDRVFLHRAHENAIARRLVRAPGLSRHWRALLARIAEDKWIAAPYGLASQGDEDEGGDDAASFNERGAGHIYEAKLDPRAADIERLAAELVERRGRARDRSIFDSYATGPSLWLGRDPADLLGKGGDQGVSRSVSEIHDHLASLTISDGHEDWAGRLALVQALRRSLLRESVLLRLLPDRSDREEARWGELLAEMFYRPLPQQTESMGDRLAVFLEDVRAASGTLTDRYTARGTLLEATRLRDQQFVALVKGGGDSETRERVFAGFNSPLLPEVLICTSVGQEGIDLHRHCRKVIHFDLAWNPAVLEQRTGRVDRIGCKAFRERAGAGSAELLFLEVGVPFLAGTYDERMYEELRLRAQVFEVLTGGDISAENLEGHDDIPRAEGREEGLRYTPLPSSMVRDLRVDLQVWKTADR